MPTYSPAAKVGACWGYGAEVVLHGDTTVEAFAECERLQGERGLTLVHPFDDPETAPGVRARVRVRVGGGGRRRPHLRPAPARPRGNPRLPRGRGRAPAGGRPHR